MPPPPPPPPPPYAAPYPALYLYPLNDSFVPKHISLVAGQRVKIGRQTNPKTAPGEKNGFFDSKVLSRQHAEIWEDGNKIYIKDVKSSNGTFINGERLSPEGVESEPYELKSDDIVEFGIDIVGEDNKSIIHHKVAARAVCVFSEQDAQIAARAEQHQQQHQQQQHLLAQQQQQQQHQNPHHPHPQQQYAQQSLMGAAQPGPNGIPGSQFNFVSGQRRPGVGAAAPQGGLGGMGGMGGSMRPPGKSGLTFEHILNRLQGELQKSRETGSELHSLNTSMSEINDVLGGNMPSNAAPYPSSLPPVRPARQTSPPRQPPQDSPLQTDHQPSEQPLHPPAALVSQFQSQLHDAQTSLAEYANKVRVLEEAVADQDLIRKEVHNLRQLFDSRRQEINLFSDEHHEQQSQRPEDDEEGLLEPRGGFDHDDDDDIQHIRMLDEVDEVDDDDDEDEGDDEDDDDDRQSLATIIPHELERVEEEDEEQLAAAEREQVDELGSEDHDRADPIDPQRERETSEERERQFEREAMRKQEDLNVGRPRTPEPSFGLRADTDVPKDSTIKSPPTSTASPRTRSGTLLAPTSNRSPSSPLALEPITSINGVSNDQMFDQILQLSEQIAAMARLTSSMETQYAVAQDTIRALEGKVGELERVVKESKEVKQDVDVKHEEGEGEEVKLKREDGEDVKPPPPLVEEEKEDVKSSLTSLLTSWQQTISSEWSAVCEEWKDERERIRRAKEEWESRIINIDSSLEKMNQLHNTTTATLVKEFGAQKQEMVRVQRELREVQLAGLRAVAGVGVGVSGVGSGEVINAHGQRGSGLVTPPSPRSQSSDSGGSGASGRAAKRRRRKKRSMSATAASIRGRVGGLRERGDEVDDGPEVDEGLSGSESDSDEVTLATESGGVVDAVKVTESASTTTLKNENAHVTKSEEGTAATRAYHLSHDRLLDAHRKEPLSSLRYPASAYDVYYDDTGSSYSSSQFASEEEVEEGKKVPGRPMRIKSSNSTAVSSSTREEGQGQVNVKKEVMPTPESLTGSVVSEHEDVKDSTSTTTMGVAANGNVHSKRSSSNAVVNFQTAGAVIVLAVAAAAVFWKVRSE